MTEQPGVPNTGFYSIGSYSSFKKKYHVSDYTTEDGRYIVLQAKLNPLKGVQLVDIELPTTVSNGDEIIFDIPNDAIFLGKLDLSVQIGPDRAQIVARFIERYNRFIKVNALAIETWEDETQTRLPICYSTSLDQLFLLGILDET